MKITIAGTAHNEGHEASVTEPRDDLELYAVMELFKQALLAYGFQPESIKDYFEGE